MAAVRACPYAGCEETFSSLTDYSIHTELAHRRLGERLPKRSVSCWRCTTEIPHGTATCPKPGCGFVHPYAAAALEAPSP